MGVFEGWQMSHWVIVAFVLLDWVIIVALVPVVLFRRKEPAATIAWILCLVFLPAVGAVLFLLIGNDRMARHTKRREHHKRLLRSKMPNLNDHRATNREIISQQHLYKLLDQINPFPPTLGNEIEMFSDMRTNYDRQLAAIAAAKHHVHMEYYIFQPDSVGLEFQKALMDAAKRGVKVRFLHDGVGSLKLKRQYLKDMEAAGVESATFIPLIPFSRRWIFNFRNHRKIVVIDGNEAFIGGANIGEEYLGTEQIGVWCDTHARISGPCVRHLQQVFAEDWAFATGFDIAGMEYYHGSTSQGSVISQVVPGGPDMPAQTYSEVFFAAITNADEQVRIMTPYFVPPEPHVTALVAAARQGVDIRIIVPGFDVHYFLKMASESFFETLLAAGVRIFVFKPGVMHSKVWTVDRRWSMMGTANFDARSMKLNFEVGLAFYDLAVTQQLNSIFEHAESQSQEISLEQWRKRSFVRSIFESFARLFSPIL